MDNEPTNDTTTSASGGPIPGVSIPGVPAGDEPSEDTEIVFTGSSVSQATIDHLKKVNQGMQLYKKTLSAGSADQDFVFKCMIYGEYMLLMQQIRSSPNIQTTEIDERIFFLRIKERRFEQKAMRPFSVKTFKPKVLNRIHFKLVQ